MKDGNNLPTNRPGGSFIKHDIRHDRNIFTRPNNAKAMITVATTFCIFSVLNGPSAAFVIAIRSSFTCFSSHSSNHPALEYLFCVTSIAGYVVYPLLNGLTSRDVRLKMLQMVRNRLTVKIIDVNEFEDSSIANGNNRKTIRRMPASCDMTPGLNNPRKSLTGTTKLPSNKSRRKQVAEILLTKSTVYQLNSRVTSAPQRHTRLQAKETELCQPYKLRQVPAALLPHSVSCPTARKKFPTVNGYQTHSKNMKEIGVQYHINRSTRRAAMNNTLPFPFPHEIST